MTKIEAGKTYRTRDGRSARILTTDKKGSHPIAGLITEANDKETMCCWREDGAVWDTLGNYDLIIQPELKSLWLNWYGEMYGYGYSGGENYNTREEADKHAWDYRTHVLEIITENGKPVDVKIHEVEK